MMNVWTKIGITLLFSVSTAYADNNEVLIFGSTLPAEQWQIASAGMRPGEYAYSTQHNKNIVISRMLSLSKKALSSIDTGNMGIHMKNVEFDFAGLDNRINVNTGQAFGVVLKDATRSKRAVYFEFRKNW